MAIEAYKQITDEDTPGPSNNPQLTAEENAERARLMRSFKIPSKYSVEGARNPPKTVNILAAFVADDWAWALSDFVRLSNLHVISRDTAWQASDFVVTSEVSEYF